MSFLGNPVLFAMSYIVLMIPTYILPYFGSNSMVVNGVAVGVGIVNSLFLLHLSLMALMIFMTWFRGSLLDKKWLIILPILAATFDLVPGLSVIPFVPTVLHLIAIIAGLASRQSSAVQA